MARRPVGRAFDRKCLTQSCADTRASPCWRKGPADTNVSGKRAVLCNACGSRFLTKGKEGLVGYLPHLRSRLATSNKPTQRQRTFLSHRSLTLASISSEPRPKSESFATSDTAQSASQVQHKTLPDPSSPFANSTSEDTSHFLIATLCVSMRRRPRKQTSPSVAAE